jgi:thiamine biosynthesis protein ThiI
MKFIVKLPFEITLKSRPVRQRVIKILESNIKKILRGLDEQINICLNSNRDCIEIDTENESSENRLLLITALQCIPGIAHFVEGKYSVLVDIHDIFEKTLAVYAKIIENKTFCVEAKKIGNHDFNSSHIEQYVARGLNQSVESAKVTLTKPDITIHLTINDKDLFIVTDQYKGLSGLPIGTQEDVLSLVSGGSDSGVASYQMIEKGYRTHYCFFNLGDPAQEVFVKQCCYYLWNKYGSSHKVKFFSVDFKPVIIELIGNVEHVQMSSVLKRMMIRVAEKIAVKSHIKALITGEDIGQVSSQTLSDFNLVERVTDIRVLRPLIACDKKNITDIAREVGIQDFTKTVNKYGRIISKNTTIKGVMTKIENEEGIFNFDILDKVVSEAKVYDVGNIGQATDTEITAVNTVEKVVEGTIIIDIRSPEESDRNPLKIDGIKIKKLPFYKLATQFSKLDHSKEYFLYCDQGVMSKLQALLLIDNGFKNVKVYRPINER